jgi:xyloglucan:xyloglucosyl transferase
MTEEETKQEAKKVPASSRNKKIGCCIILACLVLITVIAVAVSVATKRKKHASGGEFSQDFTVSWAPNHTRLSNHGRRLQLILDPESGSGFKSNNAFLFGSIKMDIKLVPADSAGTVTAYYLFSEAANHDELDFEFLGNSSGEPYMLQTNVFANGTGEREQRINLWFDPTTDYHTYGVLWNRRQIVFLVDDLPIRLFTNNEDMGMAYPNQQPMRLYSSLWNGDKWATQGGRVKIDWAHAPFIASYQNYHLDGCAAADALAPCASPVANQWWDQPEYQNLSVAQQDKLRWVEENYMVYNYCSDTKRNPTVPFECTRNSAGYLGLSSLPH